MYLTNEGEVTREEWDRLEGSHAEPFVRSYVEGGFPSDRFIVLRENHVEEYPLDFPLYNDENNIGSVRIPVLPRVKSLIGDDSARAQPSRAWWQFWKK